MMANWDLREFEWQLPGLDVPLHLVVAQNDRAVPPSQALRLRTVLPAAQITTLGGVGHLAHEEQRAHVAEVLGELFDRL